MSWKPGGNFSNVMVIYWLGTQARKTTTGNSECTGKKLLQCPG
jgi:hypothetical protein